MLANWTVDYVKMDWCDHPDTPPNVVYGQFSAALNGKTHRPMFFFPCVSLSLTFTLRKRLAVQCTLAPVTGARMRLGLGA